MLCSLSRSSIIMLMVSGSIIVIKIVNTTLCIFFPLLSTIKKLREQCDKLHYSCRYYIVYYFCLTLYKKYARIISDMIRATKNPRKLLIKKADSLLSRYIIRRDGQCVTCGSSSQLTNGHLISRVCFALRWDLRNCNCQCVGCNLRHEYRPEIYTQWFIRKYGVEEYEKMVQKSYQIEKVNIPYLNSLIEKLNTILNT